MTQTREDLEDFAKLFTVQRCLGTGQKVLGGGEVGRSREGVDHQFLNPL